jgi:chromosome segregation ATPase
MADAVVRLKVESQEYNNKIKTAVQGLQHLERVARESGKSMNDLAEEQREYVRELGQFETKTTSVRSKMREYTEGILSLQEMYDRLSDAEKDVFGKDLLSSIDQIKQRAADLKDNMGDLDEELKNMASDTAFTDGVGLMTSTLGACSAAITAWTSDSKEMEQMIRELAKIATTVEAVNKLTVAFQKQNLVLLKNPYVLAAAAIAAIGVAIGKVVQKAKELTPTQQALNDVQKTANDNAAEEITRITTLSNILHDNTRSIDERKAALTEIQALVPDYHASLTEEGSLIDDNTSALDSYINGLKRAAIAQAAFDKMVEIQKQKLEAELKVQKAQQELDAAIAKRERTQSGVVYAGAEHSITYANDEVRRKTNALTDAKSAVSGYDSQLDALDNLISANDIVTTSSTSGGSGGKTIKTTKPVTVEVKPVIPEGSAAKLQQELADLNKAWSMATTQDDRDRIAGEIETVTQKLEAMRGKAVETSTATEQVFTAGSMNDLQNQLKIANDELNNLAPDTQEWADALARVLGIQKEIANIQSKISGDTSNNTQAAETNADAWQSAVSAVGQLGGALQGLEDPTAKVAGIIAQAIANIALTFATSLKGTVTPWDWIAAAVSGTATMIGTIAAIKSATQGFSDGGMVDGKSFSGDNIVARLNAGEGVLTAKGVRTANEMANNASGFGNLQLTTKVAGTDMLICLDNTNRARGGSRGHYARTH